MLDEAAGGVWIGQVVHQQVHGLIDFKRHDSSRQFDQRKGGEDCREFLFFVLY
jgi:hypothetical protein